MFRQQLFFLSLAALLLLSSCAPKNHKALFYDYRLVSLYKIRIGDKYYEPRITYDEIQNLPEPVKKYAIVSGLLNKERVTELFFDYKVRVSTSAYRVPMNKKISINDHVSAVEPMYKSGGNSFPMLRAGSDLHKKGSIHARLMGRELLGGVALNPASITDLCVLKYLAQMVWYPTAFINKYNLVWSSIAPDGTRCINCARLNLYEHGLNARGIMQFDLASGLPLLFVGTISENTEKLTSIKQLKVSYHNFYDNEGYLVPAKCVATIENDENQIVRVEMELKETLPINMSKLMDNDFMDKMDREKKQYNKQKERISKRIEKREARKQKRALRRDKRRAK